MKPETGKYFFTNGWTMEREASFPFYWLVYDEKGTRMDRDKYRHDVIERYRLKVEREESVKRDA